MVSGSGIVCVCVLSVPLHLTVGEPAYVPLSVSGAAGFLAVVLAVLRLRNVALGGAIYATSALITLTAALLMDGGLASSASPWLAMMPAISYALGGLRAGIVGMVGTGLLTLTMAFFEPAIQASWPPAYDAGLYAVHLVLVSLSMVCLVVAREVARDKARDDALQAEAARIAAEAANSSKSRMLTSVSHEIRTPLNGILGNVELMRADSLSPTQAARLDVVQDSGELLLAILDDVLDMARFESGQLTLSIAPVSPRTAVSNVLALLRPRTNAKGLTLAEETNLTDKVWLSLDGQRVSQVLLNLVGNAIKFTDSGGVTVRHALRDGYWRVDVEDTGVGISSERLDAIFDPFVQAEQSTSRKYGGTGLGLAISRHLAKKMGGSLTVVSATGKGAIFTFRVPAVRCSPTDVRSPSRDDVRGPLHLLVVDDNGVNREVLTAMLRQLGHTSELACDGAMAVKLCGKSAFDAVLMDVEMPVMDGLEATRQLRAKPATADMFIYAVTASAFPGDRKRATDAGMDAFLAKPVRMSQLEGLLGRGRSS